MKTKIFPAILLVFLTVSLVNAASYHGSFNVDVGTGSIVIDPGTCDEDWSSSFWSDCIDNQETFVCVQTNPSCGTEYLKPANCDNTRTCGSSDPGTSSSGSGGSGSGSGGGSTPKTTLLSTENGGETETEYHCVEKWACQTWSDAENSCGIRTCEDLNSCDTNNLKPETARECASIGVAGITGAIIGGVRNFAKSGAGISLIFVILIVTLLIITQVLKKRS